MMIIFTCPECGSVHFNVHFGDSHIWLVCCEGCGGVYQLLPSGTAVLYNARKETNDELRNRPTRSRM